MKTIIGSTYENIVRRFSCAELSDFSLEDLQKHAITSFALIVHANKKRPDQIWSNLFKELIDHGAEWFCGSGPFAEHLEQLWDNEAITVEEQRKNIALVSVHETTLAEALRTTSLLATDSKKERGDSLYDCLVLVESLKQIPKIDID